MPKISVIIPNYNHAIYLQKRIDSILNQTYQDFELILLDDCSIDNSKEILSHYKGYPNVSHLVFNEYNSGSTFKQWDKGIQLAKGEYIWIAESDDWAEPELLEVLVNLFNQKKELGLAFVSSRIVDSDGNIIDEVLYNNTGEVNYYTGSDFIKRKLSSNTAIWNASMMMFRKSIYNEIDKNFFLNKKYCGDWFFYVLISEKSDVVEVKKVLNNFRVHSGNVSGIPERTGETYLESLDVFNYLIRDYSFKQRLHFSYAWAKNFFIFNQKYSYPRDIKKQIFENWIFKNQTILLRYIPIKVKSILVKQNF